MGKYVLFLIINWVVLAGNYSLSPYAKPALPTIILTIKSVSSTTINLKWSFAGTGVNQYKIFRANATTGPFTPTSIQGKKPLAVVLATQKTFQVENLEPATKYCYVVVAYAKSTTIVGYSNIGCLTTLKEPPPTPVSNLKVTPVGQHQINLSWKDNSNNETGFDIQRSVSGGPFSLLATVGPNVTTYEDKGLAANTTYCYTVKAVWTSPITIILLSVCAKTSGP